MVNSTVSLLWYVALSRFAKQQDTCFVVLAHIEDAKLWGDLSGRVGMSLRLCTVEGAQLEHARDGDSHFDFVRRGC